MSDKQTLKIYEDLPTVDLLGVEIFAEGNWNGDKYSGEDLQAVVDAFDKVGFEPTAKAGHAEGQDNLNEKEYRRIFGAPALGYVSRLYRKGKKLVADFKQVPAQFAKLINAGSYKRVSSEIYWNYKDDQTGTVYPRVLKSVAFLGAEIPALPNLKAIEALFHKDADSGSVFAYEGGHEFRAYEFGQGNQSMMTVTEKNGKWCVLQDGKAVSEHASKKEAQAAIDEESAEGDVKGQPDDETGETAPPIKDSKGNYDFKGETHMTDQEVQAKLDALKAEMTKDYEAKAELKATEAVAKAKSDAETEKTRMAERIAQLEKQSEDSAQLARKTSIESRLGKLKTEGKVTPAEEAILASIFSALPESAVHVYSDAKGAEIKEPVVETMWKLFESRKTKIFSELANSGKEINTFSDAQAEVVRRANELVSKDEKLSLNKAYQKVSKDDPELWHKYQLEVKGSH